MIEEDGREGRKSKETICDRSLVQDITVGYESYFFPRGKSRRGVGVATPSLPSAEAHERVELYLYPPSCALRACYRVNLYLYLYENYLKK
jgi:hypothetical protein